MTCLKCFPFVVFGRIQARHPAPPTLRNIQELAEVEQSVQQGEVQQGGEESTEEMPHLPQKTLGLAFALNLLIVFGFVYSAVIPDTRGSACRWLSITKCEMI